MIRALLKKQLLELGAAFVRSSKTGKQRSRVGTFGYTLLFAALMLLVMLSFGSMALPLAVTLVPQGLDWLYFVLMELSALTVSVLASAFTSYGHLFRCRDNQQLLALPIPPGTIFAVRCGGVYLTGLIYLLLAWVPSVVCYALAAPRPGGALLAALPVALALAGVSMVLVVLLGWAVALLNRRARHKSLVTVVGTLLFLAVYYAVFQWVGNAVEALAVDAVQAGAAAGRAAAPLRLLGLAAVGNVPALLLLLALGVVVLLAAVMGVSYAFTTEGGCPDGAAQCGGQALEPNEFMTEIKEMISSLVTTTEARKGANALMKNKIIGVCPNCGANVVEREKGWFCENRECRFVLWKDNAFFKRLGKRLDAHVADKLLRDGRVRLKDCKSAKGKTYNATVLLSCEADGRSKFSLEFEGGC